MHLRRILNRNTLELTKENKKLHVIIDSPSSATFRIVDNTPEHTYDSPNPGSKRILVDLDIKPAKRETLKIRLLPCSKE